MKKSCPLIPLVLLQKKGDLSKYDDTFILHNTGGTQIKKPEYMGELYQFKTNCSQCKRTAERVCSLLEEVRTITEYEVRGVCENCNRATSFNKTCKKCELIVSEFKPMHEKRFNERQERFNVWLCKVYHLLQNIVTGECMCKHRLNKDIEVERILHILKEPLQMYEPDIDSFWNLNQEKLMSLQSISEKNEALEELFSKIELQDRKYASSSSSTSSPKTKKKEGGPSDLNWKLLKDFNKTLRQQGQEDLMKILLDLCRAWPKKNHLNTDLIKDIVNTINTYLEEELPQNIAFKLINNLTELNETITDDLSQDLNIKVTQAVIGDLNEFLLLGTSKDLNNDLMIFLVDLRNLLTQKIGKGVINKKELKEKNIMPQKHSDSNKAVAQKLGNFNKALTVGVFDKNIVDDLSNDIRKEIGQMPPDELNKTIKELTNIYKSAVQGKSKTVNLELIQGLIKHARKVLREGPTKDENIKTIQSRNKTLHSNKAEVQKIPVGATKKNVIKVLRAGYTERKAGVDFINSEAGIAKSGTKSGKAALKKPFTSLEIIKRKPGIERAKKTEGRYLFQNKYKSDSKYIPEKKLGVKGKENLPPGHDKKKKCFTNQPKESSKELHTDARELSLALLLKKQAKEEKLKSKKQKLLAKLMEKEKRKNEKKSMREVRKQEKIMHSFSSRDESSSDQRTEITISGEPPQPPKDFEREEGVPEPLPSMCQDFFKNGIIKYSLSNEAFIRYGWTVLPTEKIMKRMNIYRMKPTSSRNCWFDRYKEQRELFYDTGQKLADIDENGRGRWFYRNGSVALDYYDAQESNVGQRYVVYSSGAEIEGGRIRPRTVLAIFDGLGNCVVYDLFGNIRLKYNQSEGVLMDPKIGPQSKWKWHNLNDPPVLQQVLVDTCLEERDPELEQLYTPSVSISKESKTARQTNSEMLAIELDNLVKEKRFKLKQKFRPFKITMKTVKLNQQFSLKIIDQATIYLFYGDGHTNLKLNLGMLLKINEVIDTVISDVGDVATPYDVRPAITESVENIHNILKSVRSGKP